jgi:hypothetical protein
VDGTLGAQPSLVTVQILHATREHAQQLAPLFDAYRAFFTGKSNIR